MTEPTISGEAGRSETAPGKEDRADAAARARTLTDSNVWTIQDAATYLCLPVSSLYKMTGPRARLRVPHIRIAGRLRFRRADLDRWLDTLSVSNLGALAKVRTAFKR